MYSTGTQNINLGDMNLLLLLNASNVLGIAVIRELNQAPSSLKAVSRALTLTVKFVPKAAVHLRPNKGSLPSR
jgi:hypothetical protein